YLIAFALIHFSSGKARNSAGGGIWHKKRQDFNQNFKRQNSLPLKKKDQTANNGFIYRMGAALSSSNVTTSHASGWAMSWRNDLLFKAWPDLCALNSPIRLLPSKYKSPIASSTLCLTNSSS